MSVPVISIAQMREWEKATWASGQSEAEVIRRVGLAVAQLALRLTRSADCILILAGKGHNGDDARCAAEHFSRRRVELLEVEEPTTAFPKLAVLLSLRPTLVIDGLFGIGINRPLDQSWIKLIRLVNDARLQILAVDVPSGLNADTGEPQGAAIQASVTLTVGAPKRGLLEPVAWPYVGRLEVATEVGLIPCPHTGDLCWTAPEDFAGFPPPRPVAGHKGDFGHLALICGSVGFHGAAVLAARGAQRAQPGLISLFTHEPAYTVVASQLQAVMVHPWKPDSDLPAKFSAVFIGSGLAAPDLPDEMRHLTCRLWSELEIPVIVDASALDWLPLEAPARDAIRVITPHPGEAARLLKTSVAQVQADRRQALRQLSRRLGNCWVLLKGHQTLIGRSAGPIFVNSSGNPCLAQGGAGDLLGGFLAGLLAQPALQEDPIRTIRWAVWQHGAAADGLQASRANWTVEELAAALGGVVLY
jgi:NAD(P)H-hydrate epimerase